MPNALIIGSGTAAAAHDAWFRQRGWESTVCAEPEALRRCDVIGSLCVVCLPCEDRGPCLKVLLAHRQVQMIVVGSPGGDGEDAQRLWQAIKRRKGCAAVTGGWRFVPAFARIREVVSGATIGKVTDLEVRVVSPPNQPREGLFAGLDLGCWLADDVRPAAARTTVTGTGDLMVSLAPPSCIRVHWSSDPETTQTSMSLVLTAENGQATASACFSLGLPGAGPVQQTGHLSAAGTPRPTPLPVADAVATELGAVAGFVEQALPWHGVCTLEYAARLAAVLPESVWRKVGGETPSSG